ncbi:hypothetical protein AAC387_Pa07g3169 [Persea americana]
MPCDPLLQLFGRQEEAVMGMMAGTNGLVLAVLMGLLSLAVIQVCGENWNVGRYSFGHYHEQVKPLESIKVSFRLRSGISSFPSPSPSPTPAPTPTPTPSPSPSYAPAPTPMMSRSSRIHGVTAYGADPTGETDSTEAIMRAISDAFQDKDSKVLMTGISDLGGAEVHLEGGTYKISRPLRLPASGGGNFMIHGGSLHASDDFPTDRHLIELWPSSVPKLKTQDQVQDFENSMEQAPLSFSSSYEYITIRDLMLNSNYRGGGISVINSLRTTIDNCYITHFTTDGILVQGGHETYIRNSFLGQQITAGGHKNEKNFSGIGINLMGNDNAVTDTVIFSAATGVLISGQANILTGVHCYNKATGWGGTGIYLRLPNLTQTRIVNCYLDYTGIVAEDPVQLHITGSFFLGNAYVLLKSIKGVVRGLNIVDNMFAGDGSGVDIVQLDQSGGPFTTIDQVVIDRNNAQGMTLKSTVARGLVEGNGSIWTLDFSRALLFPNLIKNVQYTLQASALFPNHALRNVSRNRVVIESDVPVQATVYAWVDQGSVSIG